MNELCDKINKHLENGGVVQITTYTRATLYTKKHAGFFSVGADGNLYVQHGRRKNCLSNHKGLMVSIRFGTYK